MKDQPLQIGIENEQLVIRLGISALAYGVQRGDEWNGDTIDDELQFAKASLVNLNAKMSKGTLNFISFWTSSRIGPSKTGASQSANQSSPTTPALA
jgi:hypothetical protein